jgi:L-seryl-tRNA(Ser) seleniumtransferase
VTSEAFRAIPSVEAVLSDARLGALAGEFSRPAVTELVRSELDAARSAVRAGEAAPEMAVIVERVTGRARSDWMSWPRRVINATGVVLHTNLGRAPLSEAAIDAAGLAAGGYSDLEFDLATGKRGSRNSHISKLIAQATGAEAGMAVNNNASAVLLALSALAAGKEAIVSRGEAVEIGGGFRVPEVMAQSGAKLVEVGTTNRTYARDYDAAVTGNTALILKVHPSNFLVTGFTHTAELEELVEVGRKHGVPVLNDLGSGSLLDTRKYGMEHEPMAQESVSAGAGLTMFSGDKLLGGPQAGIIAGEPALVERVSKHPLARAVRIDKMTLAALSATLLSYLKGAAESEIPIWRMISASESDLAARAEAWRAAVAAGEVKSARSAVGGGSLPGQTLATSVLAINAPGGPDAFAAALRKASPPVIARIQDDEALLDPRTVLPEEDAHVIAAVKGALEAAG